MSQELEDLIRTVQQRAADTADPGAVQPGIAVRATRLRRRRTVGTVVAAAAAVLVAAVAVPLSTATHHRGAPAQAPSASAPAGDGGTPLRYRITQVPPGFTEKGRIVADPAADNPEILVVRSWVTDPVVSAPAGRHRELMLFVQRRPDPSYYDNGAQVDVGGVAGWYENHPDDPSSIVSWLSGNLLLRVEASGLVLAEDTLLAAARSVRPDPATTRSPLGVSWLPAGYTLSSTAVNSDRPGSWNCVVFATSDPQDAPDSRYSLTVHLGDSTDAPEGGPLLTVAGRPARILDGTDNRSRFLVLNLADGQLLTVTANWPADGTPQSDEELIHVASATVRLDDPSVTAWIGR